MAAANLGRCRLFRNYESRQASYNPTIVQAIRVAWATPGLFPPASVGIDIFAEDLVSATHGFNNPTLEVIKEAHQVFGSNACVSSLMSLGAGRAAVRAIENDGSTSIKTLEQLAMDCEHTADEVERRIGRLGIYFRFSVDHGLELDTPSSSMGKISAHTTQYLLGDHVSSRLDVCIGSAEKESPVTLEQLCKCPFTCYYKQFLMIQLIRSLANKKFCIFARSPTALVFFCHETGAHERYHKDTN